MGPPDGGVGLSRASAVGVEFAGRPATADAVIPAPFTDSSNPEIPPGTLHDTDQSMA
jgi:hypothetical protein